MTAPGPIPPGLGHTVAEAFVRAAEAMRPHQRRHADERLTTWLDGWEQNMRDTVAPHLAAYVDHPDLPDEVRQLFATIVAPEAAFDASLLFVVIAALAYPLVGAVMSGVARGLENVANSVSLTTTISPAEAALATLKHTGDPAYLLQEAKYGGVDPTRFQIMVDTIGNPPALGELLLLLRRRQINDLRFTQGIEQSVLRDDWSREWQLLKFSPVGAGEVIAGAIKGHLDDTTAAGMISEAGIDPTNYGWLKATAGRPPGVESMLQLWNRNLAGDSRSSVTETVINDVVHQSDINDRFLPYVKELRTYIPPPRSIVPMLRSGAITQARALQLLEMHGLSAQDAQAFVTEATHTKATAGKSLTQAQVVRMYEAGFLTRADASNRLAISGHPADEITLLLDFADQARREKLANALISKVGSLYTAHKIDRSAATNALNGDSIPQATQADLFHVWDLERAAMVHHPTPAQVVGAYRRQEISALDCKTRLTNLGVQLADLGIIVADGYPPTKGAEAKAAALAVTSA